MRWFLGCVRGFVIFSCVSIASNCAQSPQEREEERARQREELKITEAKKPPSRRGPVATLTGQVVLAAGMELPEYAVIDLSRIPLNAGKPAEARPSCAASNEAARRPVQRTAKGLLTNVVVAASDFTRVKERAPRVHKVWIEGCRLRPATISATGGDTLQLINTDEVEFEPLLGPSYEPSSLEPGDKVTFPLVPGGIESLMCSPHAGCGRSDLIVFFHPVHTVTGEDGTFRISNFPAAENVRVTAWHPLFEASETFVWLEPGSTSNVMLVLTPKKRFVPPVSAPPVVSAAPAPP